MMFRGSTWFAITHGLASHLTLYVDSNDQLDLVNTEIPYSATHALNANDN